MQRGRLAWALFIIISCLLYGVTNFYVEVFYVKNLPHYDSVGSYTFMFELAKMVRAGEVSHALEMAANGYLSWLQGYFAITTAHIIKSTPQGLQLLNNLCLLFAMLSIFIAAKAYGSGDLRAYILSLTPLLPDGIYDWWGGLTDMRRDFAFLTLLTSAYFLSLACLVRESKGLAILTGVALGLAIWSRDNAIVILLFILGPMYLWRFSKAARLSNKKLMFNLIQPWIVGILIAAPYLYFATTKAIERRTNPFVVWGGGDSAWQSFVYHWDKPLALIFGRLGDHSSHIEAWQPLTSFGEFVNLKYLASLMGVAGGVPATLPVTIVIFALLLCVLAFLGFKRAITMDTETFRNHKEIAIWGAWACLAMYLILCAAVKLEKLSLSETQIPFFPSLLLFYSLAFVFGMGVTSCKPMNNRMRIVVTLSISLLVLIGTAVRLELKTPEQTGRFVATVENILQSIATERGRSIVAFLWHDTISFDTLKFYSAQMEGPDDIQKFRYRYKDREIDTSAPLPKGEDPVAMMREMLGQAKLNADYVIANKVTERYATSSHPMALFSHGDHLVATLLADKNFEPVYEYALWNDGFVVLKNKSRNK